MTIALVDADILSYRIGFACQDETEEKAAYTLSSLLEETLYSELDISTYELFLTGKYNTGMRVYLKRQPLSNF